ncbi:hypothetical protein VN24_19630 [Paenibacillus beijingensis]|uniref:Uncharacterized protein n=1 Tax=Paenibacillus beijingensis TaxID=1126833 RepID=A0A0D5NMI5_9BACL|nr:hypothetical protein VN24_19630 [Paenibacillus beijingensis]
MNRATRFKKNRPGRLSRQILIRRLNIKRSDLDEDNGGYFSFRPPAYSLYKGFDKKRIIGLPGAHNTFQLM